MLLNFFMYHVMFDEFEPEYKMPRFRVSPCSLWNHVCGGCVGRPMREITGPWRLWKQPSGPSGLSFNYPPPDNITNHEFQKKYVVRTIPFHMCKWLHFFLQDVLASVIASKGVLGVLALNVPGRFFIQHHITIFLGKLQAFNLMSTGVKTLMPA